MMELKQLTKRIFYLPNNPETDRPILSAICGDDHTLLIDAGNSSGHANLFLRELAKNQISKLFSVELTHWHWDHSFGAAAMKYPLISHEDTKSSLEKLCEYLICDVTEKYQADSAKIVDEVQSLLKRNLTELEEGIVHCFINGI